MISVLDSTITHTKTRSSEVVHITDCSYVALINTRIAMANQQFAGILIDSVSSLNIASSFFEGCYNLPSVILIKEVHVTSYLTADGDDAQCCPDISRINNSTFFNNSGGRSIITLYRASSFDIVNCSISDNNMTGITIIESNIRISGHNVIQNNRYKEGAGITLSLPGTITVQDELYLLNNTADDHGGAILVLPPQKTKNLHDRGEIIDNCTLNFEIIQNSNYSDNECIEYHFQYNILLRKQSTERR